MSALALQLAKCLYQAWFPLEFWKSYLKSDGRLNHYETPKRPPTFD